MRIQSSSTNLFPQNKITNKNKVVVEEVHYSTNYVIVPENSVWFITCNAQYATTGSLNPLFL